MNGLKIHKFSGTYEEVRDDIGVNDSWFSNNFSAHESSGWKTTRAAGILAVLMAAYPQMSLDEIAAWAWWNDLSDWNFSVDTSDTMLLSGGTIVFLDEYPWPSGGGAMFADWAAGYDIGEGSIDNRYIDPTLIQSPPSMPAPQPVPSQPTNYVPSQPAPILQPQPQTLQPTSTPAPATSAPVNPPAPQTQPVLSPASMTTTAPKPSAQAAQESAIPWGLILVGGAVALFAMSGKKGRR